MRKKFRVMLDARTWFLFGVFALLTSFPAGAAPSISHFTPTFGSSNDFGSIIIYGTGFYVRQSAYVRVEFNGKESYPAGYVLSTDGTSIQAHVAPGTTLGPGPIYVRLVDGSSTLSQTDFLVIGSGPYVDSFAPYSGGSGIDVVITGTHFTGVSGVAGVKFNGKNAASYFVNSETQITARTPVGITTGPITVTRVGVGSWTTSSNFFVPPVVTGFIPAHGRTGTNVVIRGTNFTQATAVKFNNVSSHLFTVDSANQITAMVPTNASTGKIRVETPANSPFITTSNFVVEPTIHSFTPQAGPVGTVVTVNGANFNVASFAVRFGSVDAGHSTPTFNQFTATVPQNAISAPITVTTADGSHTSAQLFHLPASIAGFTPTNRLPGGFVRINGQNFLGTTAVTFNGVPAPAFYVTNNTTLGAQVPAGVITGPISVTTPAGTISSGAQLFYGAPVLYSFNPAHGLAGTNVTLIGTNFLGASAVKFNGVTVPGTVNVVDNGRINTVVPAGATTGPVTVIGPAGTNSTAAHFVLDTTDLALSIADVPDPVFVGSNLVYTLLVTNNGPFAAPNVMLTNTLPASVVYRSSTTSQGSVSVNGRNVLGTLGTINSGAGAVVRLTVTPQSAGSIIDAASVGGGFPDSVLPNNSGSALTTVWPLPMLSITPLPGQVQVSWPAALDTFVLEYEGPLNSGSWSNVLTQPTLVDGNKVVVEPRTNRVTRFYRLRQ